MTRFSLCLREFAFGVVFVLFVLPSLPAQTQTNAARVNLVKSYLKSVGDFGYAGQMLIATKDHIQIHQTYGLANREKDLPTAPATVFGIASVSKTFTAIAILLLEQEGKLKVSDTLGSYFNHCPKEKAGISIHQLLTHSSGIGGGDFVEDYENISKADLIKKILAIPLRAKPGKKWMYSNAGYNVLAAIIEQQSGLDYAVYLRKAILSPFKLKHTFVAGENLPGNASVAKAYQGSIGHEQPLLQFNARTWGGGSVCSTAEDLFLLKKALFNPKRFSASLRQKMFSKYLPINNDGYTYYGYGCFLYKSPRLQLEIIDFMGETERGFNCTVRIFPETEETYISTSNAKHAGESWNRWFLDAHIRNLWWEDTHFVLPPPVQTNTSTQLLKYAGIYTYNNASIEVRIQGQNLIAEARGKEAVACLYQYDAKMLERCAALEKGIIQFLSSYADGGSEGFAKTMSKSQLEGFVEERDELIRKMGPYRGFSIKGFLPDSDPMFLKCPLILDFEKGSVEMFTLWNLENPAQPMIDFSAPGEQTTIAKILASTQVNTFSSYNFFKDAIDLTIIFSGQGDQIGNLQVESSTLKFTKGS